MDRQLLFTISQKALSNITSFSYQEALTLLSFVLECSTTQLLAHLEYPVSDRQADKLSLLVKRRCQGEPLAYLIGRCEFWSLSLAVTPSCLIPRQETELLVEKIIASYANDTHRQVLELGTGSGAIAIALSVEKPTWQITATDQSVAALKVAKHNAEQLGAVIQFRHGNWFQAVDDKQLFDIIISNPPYLSDNDPHLTSPLRYEPKMALVAGKNGTEMLHQLIQESTSHLAPRGSLWLEQGFDQAEAVSHYLRQSHYKNVQQYQDFQGIRRVSCARWSC